MTSELIESIHRFLHEMERNDEIVHVLLKGHLLIEEALTRIIEHHVFHKQRLVDARLTFHQKSALARAFCLRKDELGEWELLTAINTLRNEVAHKLNSAERVKRLERVKDLYFREAIERPELDTTRNSLIPIYCNTPVLIALGF